MNDAIHAVGGTVMQFVGDAVMAVFGAPEPSTDHADRAVVAAAAMHLAQAAVNEVFVDQKLQPFGLGIGLSTGEVAAAILGSEDRVEYSLVGDTVNLSARLQQWAEAGETVLSAPTMEALQSSVEADELPPALVKGRVSEVRAFKIGVPGAAG
jgi:class 3 adenylate cyclase